MAQPYRCPECRTRRASLATLAEHLLKSGHALCRCGGYDWPAGHRKGSTYCWHNPMAPVYHASRAGVDGEELKDIEKRCLAAWKEDHDRKADDPS